MSSPLSRLQQLVLGLAQGFWIGRIPFMPGTFGSALGVFWVAWLLLGHRPWIYGFGALVGIALSVWLSGQAEKIIGQTDPGSVVVDEIVAMPFCFAGWLALRSWQEGQFPAPEQLVFSHGGWWTLGIFLGFRFFDVVKPWPVRQSQALPGGWGVTVDDLLAAIYVNVVVFVVWEAIPAIR